MNSFHFQIKNIRVASGLSQAHVASQLGISASNLSRIESGEIEIKLSDIRKILDVIGTKKAQEYLEYLCTNWCGGKPVSFDHPDWRILRDTEHRIAEIWKILGDPNLKAVFAQRLGRYKDDMRQLSDYIRDTQHTVAFIGSIGIGKTTAICHIVDLILSSESSHERKPVLEVGGGATTVCEVTIKSSGNYGLLVEPHSEDSIRKEVQDFADFLLYSNGIVNADYGISDSEDLAISREIERAIRNMAGLTKKRRKSNDGKRIVEDPALDLANYLTDPRELAIGILTKMNMPRRDKRSIWCPEDCKSEPLKWIQDTFADINNGRNLEFSLPKRIDIMLPDHIIRHAFALMSEHEIESPLDLCIVDTKGIDQTAERADLERHFYDPRSISVLCSGFNDAPEVSTQTLLKRALDAKVLDIEKKSMILVLPRANEALAVKDESGSFSETDDDGYALKEEQVNLRLNSLGLGGLPCIFFNAHKEQPNNVRKSIIGLVRELRDIHKERLASLIVRVSNLIDNRTDAQKTKVISSAAKHIRISISQGRRLHENFSSKIHDDLLNAIGKAHASAVRATIRRKGGWHNLDYSHHLSYGTRAILTKKIEGNVNNFNAVLKNLMDNDDFAPAIDFLEQISDMMKSGVQRILSDAQIAGPAAFEDSLAGADADLWWPCLEEWGTGRGFRERVKDKNKAWFMIEKKVEMTLSDFFEDKWNELLDEIDVLLIAAAKEDPDFRQDEITEYKKAISLETSLSNGGDYIIQNASEDEGNPIKAATLDEVQEKLDEILGTLTDREEKVLRLRFGLGDGYCRSLNEVSSIFNITQESVRLTEARALRKMRHPSRSKKLREFLDFDISSSSEIQIARLIKIITE